MKKITIIKRACNAIIVILSFTSCLSHQEFPAEYDYSYQGNFKKYRTFDMMESVDSSMISSIVERAICSRMKLLGYKQSHKPQLVICFKIFPDSLVFSRIDQPEIEEWILDSNENLNYNKNEVNLNMGTLLILFFDKRQNRTVWQGYTTTRYRLIDFSESRSLRNAVISILDKYRFWAQGFMEEAVGGTNGKF